MKENEQKYLPQIFKMKHYHAFSSSRTQGVMRSIAPHFPFEFSQSAIDKDGRYVILKGKLHSRDIVIAGLYAPNKQQAIYFGTVFLNN